MKKVISLTISIGFIRKVFKDFDAVKLIMAESNSPNFQFLPKRLDFITGSRYLVSLEVISWHYSFLRKCGPNTQVWITSLSVAFSNKNDISLSSKKAAGSVHNSNNNTTAFPPETTILQSVADMLTADFQLCHAEY